MSDYDDAGYTVGEAAALLGISVRTLHHWESCGIVTPAARTWANYRVYSTADVQRLQQALIYRATGMKLAEIAEALNARTPPVEHLRRQRDLLMQQQHTLERMIAAVDELLEDTMNEKPHTVEEIAEILGDAKFPEYQREAEAQWGETDDWQVSQQRSQQLSASDWEAMRDAREQLESEMAAAFTSGVAPGSERANALVEAHREQISVVLPISYSKHVLIARGYVADERFRSHYERRAVGLAQWVKDSIDANARAKGIDPDTAAWE